MQPFLFSINFDLRFNFIKNKQTNKQTNKNKEKNFSYAVSNVASSCDKPKTHKVIFLPIIDSHKV